MAAPCTKPTPLKGFSTIGYILSHSSRLRTPNYTSQHLVNRSLIQVFSYQADYALRLTSGYVVGLANRLASLYCTFPLLSHHRRRLSDYICFSYPQRTPVAIFFIILYPRKPGLSTSKRGE